MATARRTQNKARTRSTSSPTKKFVKRGLVVVTTLVFLSAVGGMAFMFKSVNDVGPLVDHIAEHLKEYNSKPSIIYSADHVKLYEVYPISSDPVNVSSLPKHVTQAVLAAEDKRFYEHPGVDYMGMGRVVKKFVSRSDNVPGGSTITMQLAKKLFSASERKVQRKIQDIAIAIQLEKRYTKDQILELYLNQIYYGEQAYGLNAAAEIYFGKKAEDLDLAEAAMIARCIRTPSKENPVKNYQLANENKIVVLDTMKAEGWISETEYEKAKAEKPKVKGLAHQKFSKTSSAPYFVAAVKRELDRMGININEGGYSITTTIDTGLQTSAEEEVERVVSRADRVNVGAFICMDGQGRILAEVGGRNFSKNQYSYTTQSLLQPGSSFKSFIYSEALKENRINEDSEISNEKFTFKAKGAPDYTPKNHGGYGGMVSLYSAFTRSINVPAVRTLMDLTPESAMANIKEDFGFKSRLRPVPSAALGSNEVRMNEMLEAYSVFLLDGVRVHPYRIKEISGPTGDLIYQGKAEAVSTRIGPEVCKVMDNLMRGVVTNGTGFNAAECPEARGKTGTTNNGKSGWFCGYAKGIVGIAWAGREALSKKTKHWDLQPLDEFGNDVAAPFWGRIMRDATAKFGSDVKPDLNVQPGDDGSRHKRKTEEPADNNEEPPINDSNNEPSDNGKVVVNPGTGDTTEPPKNGDGQTDPLKDPASTIPPKQELPATEPKKPKDDKVKKPTKPSDNEMVEVEVCADSGLLATRYCPETVNKSVAKNKRPRKHCTLHKAPDEGGGGLK